MLHSTQLRSEISLDNSGITISLPTIITVDGIMKSYLEYLLACRNKSESWLDRSTFAVRLLIDYIAVNEDIFKTPKAMFVEFCERLYLGTVGKNGEDPSNLRWKPRKKNDAAALIGYITQFTDWLAIQNEESCLQLNPYRSSTSFEDRLNWAAYLQKKERAFMSHLWADKPDDLGTTRNVQRQKNQNTGMFDFAKAFPEDKIAELLRDGFVRYGFAHADKYHERQNIRDILITMLMHYGGLRISECFHIWVDDIIKIPQEGYEFVVKVYDPVDGIAPDGISTRKEYLLKQYSLKPRNKYPRSHKLQAGWKNPLITNTPDNFFTVFWYPAKAGEYFYELWRLYLQKQRKDTTPSSHPYAFTNRDGSPYSKACYIRANKRAIERIGLTYSKALCTTEHAHRHRYGASLAKDGASQESIRTALHHQSLESQITYTQPSEKQVRQSLLKIEADFTAEFKQLEQLKQEGK